MKFSGDCRKGEASGILIAGAYRLDRKKLKVRVDRKPIFVSERKVRKGLREFLFA